MGEAPGMFDQKEKAYESGMSARKIDLTGAQESHRSMNAGKSIAKTGSIGSMLPPVIDVDEGLQSNFATIYTNDQMDKGQEEPTIKGMDVANRLLKNYERNYMKKFPFEKGQYHQCIPNPYRPDEFITVMLVDRSLESTKVDKSVHAAFRSTQGRVLS